MSTRGLTQDLNLSLLTVNSVPTLSTVFVSNPHPLVRPETVYGQYTGTRRSVKG